jgi:hypothetical protein
MWNIIGEPEDVRRKNDILNGYCQAIGRDPAEIERTVVLLGGDPLASLQAYVEAGMTHFILGSGDPWNFAGLQKLMDWRAAQG